MGFFTGVKHILFGGPEPEPGLERRKANEAKQPDGTGYKQLPNLRIENTDCRNNQQNMDVRCVIKNDSDKEVFLDKIRLLGSKRELDTPLRPYEARDFVVYSGPRPTHRSYGTAEIDYRDTLGDYFQAKCRVELRQEPDKTYSIHRITVAGPMKDI